MMWTVHPISSAQVGITVLDFVLLKVPIVAWKTDRRKLITKCWFSQTISNQASYSCELREQHIQGIAHEEISANLSAF